MIRNEPPNTDQATRHLKNFDKQEPYLQKVYKPTKKAWTFMAEASKYQGSEDVRRWNVKSKVTSSFTIHDYTGKALKFQIKVFLHQQVGDYKKAWI